MVTTKKPVIEYTQNEMKRDLKCFITKKSTTYKRDSNAGNGGQKAIRHVETNGKKTEVSLSLISTLNIKGLVSPIKRQRLAEWIKTKYDSTTYCL